MHKITQQNIFTGFTHNIKCKKGENIMKISNICNPYTSFGKHTETYKHNGHTIKVDYDASGSVMKTTEYDSFDKFIEGITFDEQYNISGYHRMDYKNDGTSKEVVEYYKDNEQEYTRTMRWENNGNQRCYTEKFDSLSAPENNYTIKRIHDKSGQTKEIMSNGKPIIKYGQPLF